MGRVRVEVGRRRRRRRRGHSLPRRALEGPVGHFAGPTSIVQPQKDVAKVGDKGEKPGGGGPFIEAFIAADMSMRSPGRTLDLLTRGGLEVRSVRGMREHYAWTAEQWRRRFAANRAEVVERWGEELARVGPVSHRRDAQFRRGLDGRRAVCNAAHQRDAGMLSGDLMSGASGVAVATLASAAVLLILQTATFAVSRRLGRVNVVDVTWGPGFALVALEAVGFGLVRGGSSGVLALAVAALMAVWGVRLAVHTGRQSAGRGEDPCYRDMLAKHGGLNDDGTAKPGSAFLRVFLLQAGAQRIVSLPVQALALAPDPRGFGRVVAVVGVVLAAVGIVYEAVADAQLAAYKRDPDRPPVRSRGLWKLSRPSNYFGDACLWWGVCLAAASTGWTALTIVSPLLMTYFLVWATGTRMWTGAWTAARGGPNTPTGPRSSCRGHRSIRKISGDRRPSTSSNPTMVLKCLRATSTPAASRDRPYGPFSVR